MDINWRKRLRIEEGWSTLFLVWVMVVIGAMAIRQADLISGLDVLFTVSSVAVLVGLVLAKSQLSPLNSFIFSVVYGLALITFLVGRDLPGEFPHWQARIFDLVERQLTWMGKVFTEESSRDGLIFVMHTAVVYWLVGYLAAWYTFRTLRIWRVVLPSGIVLLSVVFYYYGPAQLGIFLAFYALVALVYIARTYLDQQEKGWRSAAVRYEQGIRFNFLRASLLAGALALAVAWSLPALPASATAGDAFNEVASPWRRFQEDWTRLFSALRSYGISTNDAYGDSLTLAGPRTVGNTPVMDVFVSERIPNVYWQGLALDTYAGGRWTLSDGENVLLLPDEGPLALPELAARRVLTQTVVNYIPNAGIMYAAPEVLAADRQIFVTQQMADADNPQVAGIKSRYVMRQNEVYEVQSRISSATSAQLRSAGTGYPDWIGATYLQLPGTISPETIALAEEVTASAVNPFDKAIAVRNYLREAILYNDQIDAPPANVDPVHYVLFEKQEGYCNYYASAMAVMLRSQGVPARIVQGYAQGEYNEEDNFYRVRANNAHTWVEVYFPDYGWIQFEPTASLPVVSRAPGAGGTGDGFQDVEELDPQDLIDQRLDEGDLGPQLDGNDPLGDGLDGAETAGLLPAWALPTALGIVILLLAYGGFVFVNRTNRGIEADVEKSYGRLTHWAQWLGLDVRPTHTPYERAEVLATAVPEGQKSIFALTQQYVIREFSRRKSNPFFNSLQEWKTLRPLLLRETLSRRLQMVKRRLTRLLRRR